MNDDDQWGWQDNAWSRPDVSSGDERPRDVWVASSDNASKPGRRGSLLRWFAVVVVSALVGGGVGAFAATSQEDQDAATAERSSNVTSPATVPPSQASVASATPSSIRSVLARVQPAVVTIEVDGTDGVGTGTGMIITPDGQILTNSHVAGDGGDILVTLNGDKVPKRARLLGKDETIDTAIIKIENVSNLPTVEFGDSTTTQVGDEVVAIGNALALAGGPSVTTGIVSAKDRSIPEENGAVLDGLIQTDAAINFGNSGGPLSNMAGQVVGMNTAVIRGDTGEFQNIGFALSINSVKPVLVDLAAGKVSTPGYLGVNPETLTDEIRDLYGLTPEHGAVVSTVQRNSPAARAGLARYDVITQFDGKDITTAEDLVAFVRSKRPGDKVAVVYYRGSEKKTVSVSIESRPS